MTIKKHQHNMGNLEDIYNIIDTGTELQYQAWACWTDDCDYHEYRYVELPTLEIVGVELDDKEA